jgi:hypothetical protein
VENTLFKFPSLHGLAAISEVFGTFVNPGEKGDLGAPYEGTDQVPIKIQHEKKASWEAFGLWYFHLKSGVPFHFELKFSE